MTRDYWRKKAVRERAAATDRSYLDAARTLDPRLADRSASARREDLVAKLEAAGWPTEIEHHPEGGALRSYPGPGVVDVARTTEPRLWTGDEHPDDPDLFDPTAPLKVVLWAPLIVDYSEEFERVLGVDAHEIPAALSAADIVAEIDRVVGNARRRDHADTAADEECGICGDHYPAAGLFQATDTQVEVCPSCVFDGDLLGPGPARLTFLIDRAMSEDLAIPAGWAGVQALLCCLHGPNMLTWLEDEWDSHGSPYSPREWWAEVSRIWIWLPPAECRPPALAGLGCGASLAHVISAIDRAHPGLKDTSRAYYQRELGEDPDIEDNDLDDAVLERLWPAAVAYTVALLTQQAERPSHRAPWHVLQSFELIDWIGALDSDLDYYQVECVLDAAIPAIRDALDPAKNGWSGENWETPDE